MKQSLLVDTVAEIINDIKTRHTARIAIDGVDAAGKTTFADALVFPLEQRGRTVIRSSVDGFHRPRRERYRRGSRSPEGYYHDAFDYQALGEQLLDPLGPGGNGKYRTAIIDVQSDQTVNDPFQTAPAGSILVLDGVFLQRPVLRAYWDLTVYLDATFDEALARALERDVQLFGSALQTKARYEARHIPGQLLYMKQCRPKETADILIDNNNPNHPEIIRLGTVTMEEKWLFSRGLINHDHH